MHQALWLGRTWEVTAWDMLIWEVATKENTLGEFLLGKMPLKKVPDIILMKLKIKSRVVINYPFLWTHKINKNVIIIIKISCRHQCKEFGKAFQLENGSFYPTFYTSCQSNKNWTSTSIPHPCECK